MTRALGCYRCCCVQDDLQNAILLLLDDLLHPLAAGQSCVIVDADDCQLGTLFERVAMQQYRSRPRRRCVAFVQNVGALWVQSW